MPTAAAAGEAAMAAAAGAWVAAVAPQRHLNYFYFHKTIDHPTLADTHFWDESFSNSVFFSHTIW